MDTISLNGVYVCVCISLEIATAAPIDSEYAVFRQVRYSIRPLPRAMRRHERFRVLRSAGAAFLRYPADVEKRSGAYSDPR